MYSNKLRYYRTQANMSQRALADASELCHQTLVKIETGQTKKPSDQTKRVLSNVLNIPIEKIFPVNYKSFTRTELKKKLIDFFSVIDLVERERVFRLIGVFIKETYGE